MTAEALRIDFEMNHEHEMVIYRPSGIARSELDEVEVCMLQGNLRMPHLLHVDWTDRDGMITFRYPLSGRKLLTHWLQTRSCSMRDFYTLLLIVVETLDDCKDYMLRPEGFLLDEHAIFVGERLEHVSLCYVPIANGAAHHGMNKVSDALLSLAVKWLGSVSKPDGEGMKRVFQYLRDDQMSWRTLRQVLLQLIGESVHPPVERGATSKESAEVSSEVESERRLAADVVPEPRHINTGNAGQPRFTLEPPSRETRDTAHVHVAPLALKDTRSNIEDDLPAPSILTEEEEEALYEEKARMRWIFGAGFVIGAAVIWRFLYMPSGTNRSMLLSAGLTLVLAAAAMFFWKKRYGASSEEPESMDWSVPADQDRMVSAAPTFPSAPVLQHSAGMPAAFPQGRVERAEQVLLPAAAPVYSDDKQPMTQMISNNEATVWLGGGTEEEQAVVAKRWLMRESDGQSSKIEVGGSVMIGRATEGVDYTDPSPGISRTHLEIQKADDMWTAKDVGSRNGSTLNGQAMIPYKSYALNDGDVVQLAGEKGPKYVLRTG